MDIILPDKKLPNYNVLAITTLKKLVLSDRDARGYAINSQHDVVLLVTIVSLKFLISKYISIAFK